MGEGEAKQEWVIVVSDYDPGWVTRFEALRERIWPHVDDIALAFEHVGSTSVSGLAAKPIVDVDIVVANMDAVHEVIARLRPLGYLHRGEMGVSGRHAFFHPEHAPAHHLYVCLHGSLGLRNHLLLRDHLRSHPEARLTYARLKRELAQRYPKDIDAYIHGKTPFILGILERSGMTPAELLEIAGANDKPVVDG